MSGDFSSLISALGWALVHFCWQGAVIGLVTAALLFMLRNAKAQTRYALGCSSLVLCVLVPIRELSIHLQQSVVAAQGITEIVAISSSSSDLNVMQQAGAWLSVNLSWIVLWWAIAVAVLSLRLLCGLWWLRSYSRGHRGTSNHYWQHRLDSLSQQFYLQTHVVLRVVNELESPITIGWLNPMVLIPASLVTGMAPAYLEALIAHELAHISRYDYLVNLIQNLIEMLLFFHPAVWWISKKIRNEREHIADDLAARILGEPRRLALALQELETLQFSTPQLAQAAHGGNLMSRIKRLVRPEVQAINWKTAVTVIGVTAAFLGVAVHAAVPMVGGLAQSDEQAPAANDSLSKPKTMLTVEVPGAVIRSNKIESKSKPQMVLPVDASKTVIRSNKLDNTSAKKMREIVRAADIDFSKEGCKVDYPRVALRNEWAGTTALEINISAEGKIANVKIAESSGHDVLDNAVRDQLLSGKCTQKPASINGVPQMTTTHVKYKWVLEDVKRNKDIEKPKTDNVSTVVSPEQGQNRRAQVDFSAPECRPEYPRASLRNSEQGRTEMSLTITDTGTISDIAVVRSSGFHGLDNAIVKRLQQSPCLAAPAMKNGVPVASNLSIAYIWKLN